MCPNEHGNRITPSYVAWDSTGQQLVGDAAKNQATSNPLNTVFDAKRLIGRKYSDPIVQKDAKLFPFKSMCIVLSQTFIANLFNYSSLTLQYVKEQGINLQWKYKLALPQNVLLLKR